METLFSNLSTYNVLNFIFPGATMCYAARYFLGLKLPTELSMLSELLLYYFVGLTISRIATLFVEYFCRETKLIVYADYSDYLYAEKVDAKIAVLNEQNNSYRNFLTVFIIIAILKFKRDINFTTMVSDWDVDTWIIIGFISLFALSYRKQTNYIRKRVLSICKDRGDK